MNLGSEGSSLEITCDNIEKVMSLWAEVFGATDRGHYKQINRAIHGKADPDGEVTEWISGEDERKFWGDRV